MVSRNLFFLVTLSLLRMIQAHVILDTDYEWRTGLWDLCTIYKGSCGQGNRTRSVWCSNTKTDETAAHEFCKDKPRPATWEPCTVACRHHKGHLNWNVGSWGQCLVAENQVMEYGIGLMERPVTCVLTAHNTLEAIAVDAENCEALNPKPETIKTCNLPFKQDCVTTELTLWSPCCDGYQYRTRTILKEPKNNGQPCPELVEWRTCDTAEKDCIDKGDNYRWRLGEWTACTSEAPEGLSTKAILLGRGKESFYKFWPQVATQMRSVECFNVSGEVVEKSYCGKIYGLPITARACEVSRDCVVSPWSAWKTIQRGCIDTSAKIIPQQMIRRREILTLPEGDGLKCPDLIEKRSITDNLPFCIDLIKWQTSTWSSCLEPITHKKVDCGGGLQFRNITCVDIKSGQPLPPTDCRVIQPPPTIQRCEMACPRDCQVDQWNSWGFCLPTQCPEHSTGIEREQRGIRKRFRSVLIPPSEFGIECPNLSESQPCQGTQCFMWSPGIWSSCHLLPVTGKDGRKCGPGKRSRSIYCVTHEKEMVEDYKCEKLEKPKLEENCTVPCSDDCVASSWSDWSPCSKQCSDGKSVGFRYRNRTIIAPHNIYREGVCPIADDLEQVEPCNTQSCDAYSWLAMPWQKCNGTCGQPGVEIREVWCYRNYEFRVDDSRCEDLPKPPYVRPCVTECEPECRLSDWSPWSKCPEDHCFPSVNDDYLKKNGKYYRRRTRISLDNLICGDLEEIELCPYAVKPCPNYSWAIGTWTECQLPKDARCGRGLRTRDISCINDTNDHVEIRLCLNSEKDIPSSSQVCYIDCLTSCQSTEWTPWTSCYKHNAKERTRTRQLIGGSENHSTCSYITLKESEPCHHQTYYNEIIGDWSPCIINSTSACGHGYRYRRYGCFKKDSPVEPSLCGYKVGLERDHCTVPCPQDCQLGEWTEWTRCSSICGPGTQTRERQVLTAPSYGGRKCGSLWEQKPCIMPCSNFQWQTESWSECALTERRTIIKPDCGIGQQSRKVWCMDVKTSVHVDDAYCDWTTKPESNTTCRLACPGDCVLSEWSEWSICSKGCPIGEQQQRTRSLLRNNGALGSPCPHAIQTRPCELNKTCFTYKWSATPFSSCLPLGGSPCGEGMITRIVYCERSDGRTVDDSFCDDQTKPSVDEKWCYIDCSVDCEFGGWSEWNITECTCNDTAKSRHAYVKTNPSSAGRDCPANYEQWMPCPVVPCYQWRTGDWSPCQLHGASCGHGTTVREVKCTRSEDKISVDYEYCASSTKPSDVEKCFVPCITGCQLATWTEWSPCHGDCRYDRIGYSSRARQVIHVHRGTPENPCPDPLWETRDCEVLSCPSYEWKISPDGTIICIRSDGVTVAEGCDDATRPKLKCINYGDRCLCTENVEFPTRDGKCPNSDFEIETWISPKRLEPRLYDSITYDRISVVIIVGLLLVVIIQGIWYCWVVSQHTKRL